jgi:hypothetical protein
MAQLKDFQVGSAGDPVTVGGVLTVQAGSASTPALTTAGDTNTGIFFPAADTIAFAEGGAEIARFDSGGNLGLGVTPSAWSGYKVLQVGTGTADGALSSAGNETSITTNAYNATGWKYQTSSQYATKYFQSNGQHIWQTAGTGTAGNAITFTQAMTLDASGRLGIGTTSPSTALSFADSAGTAGDPNKICLFAVTGTPTYGFGISANQLNYVSGDSHVFFSRSGSTSTERARIDSSGNLLIGTTSLAGTGVTVYKSGAIKVIANGQTLANTVQNCYANSNADNTDLIEFNVGQYQRTCMFVRNSGAGAGNSCAHITFQYGAGTNAGYISSTGTTTSYTSASDYRLKENVQPMQNALAKVAQLNPVTFTWKDNGFDGQGFIAHELQAVVPDAVVGEKDAVNEDGSIKPQAIDTSFLVATLTAALQEQQAIIENLKARLDAANL